MTLQNLIQAYNVHITEVRLKKFYADFNNAIRLSSIENDDPTNWEDYYILEITNQTNATKTRDAVY